jgi:hypothetical protein
MNARNAEIVAAHPVHWTQATTAASWLLYMDNRLVALPKTRDRLLELSCLKAIGFRVRLGKRALEKFDDRTREVVEEMLALATETAKVAIADLPPVEGLPCRVRKKRSPTA